MAPTYTSTAKFITETKSQPLLDFIISTIIKIFVLSGFTGYDVQAAVDTRCIRLVIFVVADNLKLYGEGGACFL